MRWADLDPKVVAALVDGIEEVASWAWHRVVGEHDPSGALIELKDRATQAALMTLQAEILRQAAILGLRDQLDELGGLVNAVQGAMTALDTFRRVVPPLELDIEELPEG